MSASVSVFVRDRVSTSPSASIGAAVSAGVCTLVSMTVIGRVGSSDASMRSSVGAGVGALISIPVDGRVVASVGVSVGALVGTGVAAPVGVSVSGSGGDVVGVAGRVDGRSRDAYYRCRSSSR